MADNQNYPSRLEKDVQPAEQGSTAAHHSPGRWLNSAGAVAILFGVAYFLKYGFDSAWKVGMLVRIQNSARNPLAGHTGTIIAISSADPYGPYLVEFEDGLRFRY